MSGKKKRPPLEDIHFGSGMTAGTRPPALTDQPYRDKVERGAPVDSRVRRSADESFLTLRWRCEQFSKDVFEAEGLPDPFSFIHINGKQHPLEGHFVTCGGKAEVDRVWHVGYRLAAHELGPQSEDHTDLCFASRMALIITRLDILKADAESLREPAAALIDFGAQFGSALGRLAAEKGLTDKWQSTVDHSQKFSGKRTDAANRQRGRDAAIHAQKVIELARERLSGGDGRTKGGRINVSDLAGHCVDSMKSMGKDRARQIIREAIKRGVLGIAPTSLPK